MKLITWNVNGIRACLKKGFAESMLKLNPDIISIQETKSEPVELGLGFSEYKQYWNSADKKGYSGTAVFTKVKPLSVKYDIEKHDKEGRVITLEFKEFFLVNVYTPNSQRGLARLDYRMQWERDFRQYLSAMKKPIILCGDLNVAHKEIDLKNPKSNMTTKTRPGNAGFTDQERNEFTKLLDMGFVDVFRKFYPDSIKYTWWSYMFNARKKNVGWRIDYFLVRGMIDKVKDVIIHDEIMGSDHCPVELVLT